MSLWLPKFRPYRCMRGANVVTSSVTNYATVSLYNNSTGAELLVVLNATPFLIGGAVSANAFSFKGALGTVAGSVVPLVTGEATLAGQIYVQDAASKGTPDYLLTNNFGVAGTQFSNLPFAVLQPGWSFVMQQFDTGGQTAGSFLWQVVHPHDLLGDPCQICDPHARIVGGHVV